MSIVGISETKWFGQDIYGFLILYSGCPVPGAGERNEGGGIVLDPDMVRLWKNSGEMWNPVQCSPQAVLAVHYPFAKQPLPLKCQWTQVQICGESFFVFVFFRPLLFPTLSLSLFLFFLFLLLVSFFSFPISCFSFSLSPLYFILLISSSFSPPFSFSLFLFLLFSFSPLNFFLVSPLYQWGILAVLGILMRKGHRTIAVMCQC